MLRSFLGALFEESATSCWRPSASSAPTTQLELSLFETRARAQVAAPLRGLAIVSPEVPLGGGLALVRADAMTEPPGELARLATRVARNALAKPWSCSPRRPSRGRRPRSRPPASASGAC